MRNNHLIVAIIALILLLSESLHAQTATLSAPVFSHESGFYSEAFMLEITHHDPNVLVYVTFDGSEPGPGAALFFEPYLVDDATSNPNVFASIPTTLSTHPPERFLEPVLKVPKSTIIRARAVDGSGAVSEIISHTYFVFNPETTSFTLPIFSIIVDPVNFFDDELGIYVPGELGDSSDFGLGNFNERSIEWERDGFLQYFDEKGDFVHGQDVGFRIHGGWSRRFAQKSLRVYARNQYENRVLPVEFFPGEGIQPYRRIVLRNSGSEWGLSMLRDGLAHELISHLNLTTQKFQPSVVFINGEYWGIHNIRERVDRHYLERRYAINPDNIDILVQQGIATEGTSAHYSNFMHYVRTSDLSSPEVYETVKTLMDTENYLDYYATQVYLGNNDWPHNNIDFWRLRVPYNEDAPWGHDGRWRWITYDLDRSFHFGNFTNATTNMIWWTTLELDGRYSQVWPNELFRKLLENDDFRRDFINRTADILNTTFLSTRIINAVDSLAVIIEPEMGRQVQRWSRPTSKTAWYNELSRIRNFADNRPAHLRNHVRDYFKLGGNRTISLSVNNSRKGYIRINSTDLREGNKSVILQNNSWSGDYYDGIPVRLEAVPEFGYRFVHWVVNSEEITTPILMSADMGNETYFAVFEEVELGAIVPEAFIFDDSYVFEGHAASALAGSYPANMAFVFMDQPDPIINANIEGFTMGVYNLTSRTRVNGLGSDGVSFINTGNLDGNPGYPGGRLGGALLSIDTRGQQDIRIQWSGGTISPNSRVYNLRLQYRIGDHGPFEDLLDVDGNPSEYKSNEIAAHTEAMTDVLLPKIAEDRPYVQLFWRYYFTGAQVDLTNGQRSKLRLYDLAIEANSPVSIERSESETPESLILMSAYPNPFNSSSNIEVKVPQVVNLRLSIFDAMGRRIITLNDGVLPTGSHTFVWDAENAASGVYMVVSETNDITEILKITLVK